MAAIVTTNFRFLNAENFKADISSNSVYVGIGKSDAWSDSTSDVTDSAAPVPGDTIDDINEAYEQLIGISKIAAGGVSHVVPRHNWVNGEVYTPWSSGDSTIYDEKFYVITNEFKVYKLISIAYGSTVSTVQPTHTSAAPLADSDGYSWKYMYTLGTTDVTNFLTTSYMPVKTIDISTSAASQGLDSFDTAQHDSQSASAALAGAQGIQSYAVTSTGSGYTTATATVTGDGTSATATVTIVGGQVVSVNSNAIGSGYTQADVVISGDGTGAEARANIEPGIGHGTDPVRELGGFFIGLRAVLDGSSGDITVANDFRQISLIKNPTNGAVITADTVQTMKAVSYSGNSPSGSFLVDEVLTGGTSGAVAFIVDVDESTGKIFYIQNDKTGYGDFQNGEIVTSTGGGSVALHGSTANIDPDFDTNSGEMIFLENRDPISRSASQIEDIKLIIEF